ncbi:MAG: hypothetical protein AAFX65_11525 [Cyanobacteria bacterium J06638_7]
MALPRDPFHRDLSRDGPSGGAPRPDPRRLDPRRLHLQRSWRRVCDIDPMILRVRLLRRQGSLLAARSMEQELLPPF